MKQIINWTCGSFFKSIGRIIAYLVIGGIITFLVIGRDNLRHVKLTDLLGIERVMASDFSSALLPSPFYYKEASKTNSLGIISGIDMTFIGYENSGTVTNAYDFYFSNDIVSGNANTIRIPLYMQLTQTLQIDTSYSITAFLNTSSGLYVCNTINASSNQIYSTLICPFKKGDILRGIQSNVGNFSSGSYGGFKIGLSPFYTLEYDSSTSIVNAQNQTTNSINSMNQTISDTNATSDVSSASNYFNDFNETAQDGIKAIVSMPLNIFNALTLGSTKDLCFNLKGKQSCFPSGAMLWNKSSRTSIHAGNATWTPHPFSNGGGLSEQLTLFKSLFNIVVGGYLGYKMLKSLMRITNDMLSPTHDKVEVLDL